MKKTHTDQRRLLPHIGRFLRRNKWMITVPAVLSLVVGSIFGFNAFRPAEASGNLQRIAYYGNWDLYEAGPNNTLGNNYTLKDVHESGAASQLTTLVYSFENIHPTSFECFQDVSLVSTDESNPDAGDGAADAWADYQYPFPAERSIDGVADSETQPLRGNFNQLKKLKLLHPNLKIMLSIGGWTFSKYFSDAAQSAHRANFVSSCINMYIRGNLPTNVAGDTTAGGAGVAAGIFDGLDIDWEFPGSPNGHVGNHYSVSDTANFTALLAEFRSQLDAQEVIGGKQYRLTAAVPSGGSDMSHINVPAVEQYLDYAGIMSYDMHGAWENDTNFNAPLYPSASDPDAAMGFTVDQAVERWQNAGMPSNKILVGLPFYWRGWSGVSAGLNHGLYQSATGGSPAFPITNQAGVGNYKELLAAGKLTNIHEDAASGKSPWVYNNGVFLTGDTPKSLSIKGNYIRSEGLAGAMIYALEGDDRSGTLMSAVMSGLNGSIVPNPPPTPAIVKAAARTSPSSKNTATAGEPVNMVGGNFLSTRHELKLPNWDNPIDFSLNYNSALASQISPVGMGWTHSYQITATPMDEESDDVIIKNSDGRMDLYEADGNGGYTAPEGIFDTLSLSGAIYTVTHKDKSIYTFNDDGQISSIVGPNGNAQTMEYNAAGQLETITDSFNRSFTFAYDQDTHLLTSVTDPIDRQVQYAYNGLNELVQVTNPADEVTKYAYDSAHQLTTITDPRGHDVVQNVFENGRVSEQTNALGKTVTFDYDLVNGKTTYTDAKDNTTQYFYDSSLRITKVTDALNHDTITHYDSAGNPDETTDSNNHTTTREYDAHGNVLTITDPNQVEQHLTYDNNDNLKTATDQNGHETTYDYDTHGNLTLKTDPMDRETSYDYGANGRLNSITDSLYHLTGFGYDDYGNLDTKSDPSQRNTYYGYDGAGRLIAVETHNNHRTDYTLDPMDRVTMVTDPSSHSTKYEYDADGNKTKVTDANGHMTEYEFDNNNQLTKVTNSLEDETTYTYDDNGNLETKTDAKNHEINYAYDELNRQITTTDSLNHVTTLGYDNVGNVISREDASNRETIYAYNNLDRLTTVRYPDTTAASYTYDPAGNRLTATNSAGTTTTTYYDDNQPNTVTDPHSSVVTYTFNGLGSLYSQQYPDNKTVTYNYTPSNQLSTVTDWNSKVTSYLYDNDAQLASVTYPNTISATYTYDVNGRLDNLTYKKGTATFTTFAYDRDYVGNITQEQEARPFPNNPLIRHRNFAYDHTDQLTYEEVIAWNYTQGQGRGYQLPEEGTLVSSNTYTYDEVSNMASVTNAQNATTTYTSNNANQLTSTNTRTLTYDNQGNRITDTGKTLGYNFDNQLISYANGSLTTNYVYDAAGNRIDKTQTGTGAINTRYVNTANNTVITAKNLNTSTTNFYVYGLGLISQGGAANTSRQYSLTDGMGNVRYVTTSTGTTVTSGSLTYDAYGQQTGGSTTLTNYAYQNEQKDPESILIFLRARYYDPTTSRFTSLDPVSGTFENPVTQNGYNYVGNNPVNHSDPSGMFWETLWDIANIGYDIKTCNWGALAFDTFATFVPFLPAGLTKVAKIEKLTYTVYHGLDPISGIVKYVGITKRLPQIRFAEHLASATERAGLLFEVIPGQTGLTKLGARLVEQAFINEHGLIKNGGKLLNKINSIRW